MNVFGIDILQLVIYACVVASLVVVAYILKLTRNRNKTKTQPKPTEEEPTEETFSNIGTVTTPNEIIKQLIALIDKMYSHQVGLNPSSCSNPKPEPAPLKRQKQKKQEPQLEPEPKPEPEPTPSHSIQEIDEETYTPTDEDNELLETIRKQLEGEK